MKLEITEEEYEMIVEAVSEYLTHLLASLKVDVASQYNRLLNFLRNIEKEV